MGRLILLRHGQSQWNLENRFTGWIDVPLSDKGSEEALLEIKREYRPVNPYLAPSHASLGAFIESRTLAPRFKGVPPEHSY